MLAKYDPYLCLSLLEQHPHFILMSSRYTSMSVQPEKKAKPVKSTMNQETVPLTSLSAIQVDPISEPKVTIPVVETKSESPIAEPEPAVCIPISVLSSRRRRTTPFIRILSSPLIISFKLLMKKTTKNASLNCLSVPTLPLFLYIYCTSILFKDVIQCTSFV